jgi:hypothetical protein
MTAFDRTSRAGPVRAYKRPRGQVLAHYPRPFTTKKGRERHLPVAHGPLARSVAAYQLWSLRKLGAVWLRANTPSGPTLRARARKLSVVMSFVVAFAMLQSTFLVLTGCTKVTSAVLLFYIRRKHITTTAGLSSSVRSDFRRMFPNVRRCSPKIARVQHRAANPETASATIRQCSPVFAYVRL